MQKGTIITKQITSSVGVNESSEVVLSVCTLSGKAVLIVSKTITEVFPVTSYEEVIKLHNNLTRGGGRRAWKLKDLAK